MDCDLLDKHQGTFRKIIVNNIEAKKSKFNNDSFDGDLTILEQDNKHYYKYYEIEKQYKYYYNCKQCCNLISSTSKFYILLSVKIQYL